MRPRARSKIENETFNVLKKQWLSLGPQLRARQQIPGQKVRYYELAGLRLPHRLGLAGNTLATSQALATLKGFFEDFLPICFYVVFASSCLFLQEAPHRDSDHRQGCATHIEQQVSILRGTPRWISRAGPTATHWPSPLKGWVSPRRFADERKQQVLRLGACPPLFNRTQPLKLPGGTTEKVDFTCAPRIANNSCFI